MKRTVAFFPLDSPVRASTCSITIFMGYINYILVGCPSEEALLMLVIEPLCDRPAPISLQSEATSVLASSTYIVSCQLNSNINLTLCHVPKLGSVLPIIPMEGQLSQRRRGTFLELDPGCSLGLLSKVAMAREDFKSSDFLVCKFYSSVGFVKQALAVKPIKVVSFPAHICLPCLTVAVPTQIHLKKEHCLLFLAVTHSLDSQHKETWLVPHICSYSLYL